MIHTTEEIKDLLLGPGEFIITFGERTENNDFIHKQFIVYSESRKELKNHVVYKSLIGGDKIILSVERAE